MINNILTRKDTEMAKQTNYSAKTADINGFINYSEEEHSVWSDLFNQQQANIQHYAANDRDLDQSAQSSLKVRPPGRCAA